MSRAWRKPAMYALPRPSLAARCRTLTSGTLRRQLVGELAGAVGGVVVDDQGVQLHAVAVRDLADTGERVPQVLALVVGRKDDDVHGGQYTQSSSRVRRNRHHGGRGGDERATMVERLPTPAERAGGSHRRAVIAVVEVDDGLAEGRVDCHLSRPRRRVEGPARGDPKERNSKPLVDPETCSCSSLTGNPCTMGEKVYIGAPGDDGHYILWLRGQGTVTGYPVGDSSKRSV